MNNNRHGVSYHGKLNVEGTQLINESGEAVVLKGMSSHGMQWYPQFARTASIRTTKHAGANVFRIAMYTDEDGYLTDKSVAEKVCQAVDETLALDMYAIIDWHILLDNNPLAHVDEAKAFFEKISQKYKNEPGVIYEICNEPNGTDVTWEGSVKPYAQQVIPVIRTNAPDAIILVGCPTWSQDVDSCAADPLNFKNILYTLHFYAGTHGDDLRQKCLKALAMGAPVFVSEWGTSAADGSGGVFLRESDEWLDFLATHTISWCNWSLGDRDETSAALLPGAPLGNWTSEQLSESGRYVFAKLNDPTKSQSRD